MTGTEIVDGLAGFAEFTADDVRVTPLGSVGLVGGFLEVRVLVTTVSTRRVLPVDDGRMQFDLALFDGADDLPGTLVGLLVGALESYWSTLGVRR